jgi:hypothetical protein
MTASREDIVREARLLVGTKVRDHFELLTTIARKLNIVDQATIDRHNGKGASTAFASLRRCVVSRRFGVQIPLNQIEAGDFCTTLAVMQDYFTDNPDVPCQFEGDQVMIMTETAPRTYIFVDQHKSVVVEEERDFELTRAFRLRQRVDLDLGDEISIIQEHAAMAQRLLTSIELARHTVNTVKMFRFTAF